MDDKKVDVTEPINDDAYWKYPVTVISIDKINDTDDANKKPKKNGLIVLAVIIPQLYVPLMFMDFGQKDHQEFKIFYMLFVFFILPVGIAVYMCILDQNKKEFKRFLLLDAAWLRELENKKDVGLPMPVPEKIPLDALKKLLKKEQKEKYENNLKKHLTKL